MGKDARRRSHAQTAGHVPVQACCVRLQSTFSSRGYSVHKCIVWREEWKQYKVVEFLISSESSRIRFRCYLVRAVSEQLEFRCCMSVGDIIDWRQRVELEILRVHAKPLPISRERENACILLERPSKELCFLQDAHVKRAGPMQRYSVLVAAPEAQSSPEPPSQHKTERPAFVELLCMILG